MLIHQLESHHKEPDTNVFMMALSKIMEFTCQFYLKTATKSHIRIIDINAVAQCINDIINKTDCDKDTFLKALLAFHCFLGCDKFLCWEN